MPAAEILATYALATPEEIAAGREWYADARRFASVLVGANPTRGLTLSTAAGVIAALSPQSPWERNKELALRAVVDGHASGTLGNSVRKADRILSGEPVLDVLTSDKVRNFYLSIMGHPNAVCIDRHAWEVFEGKRYTDATRPRVTPKRYKEAADAYRQAARTLGELDATSLQAITWLVWRRIHLTGTRYERFL
jgi:hypothetical protein